MFLDGCCYFLMVLGDYFYFLLAPFFCSVHPRVTPGVLGVLLAPGWLLLFHHGHSMVIFIAWWALGCYFLTGSAWLVLFVSG